MKIKETYVVYHEVYDEYVKLHRCLSYHGDEQAYYLERNSGSLLKLEGVEFYELLKDF
jgi:hypothetical protein